MMIVDDFIVYDSIYKFRTHIRQMGETGKQELIKAWIQWGYDYPFNVRTEALTN